MSCNDRYSSHKPFSFLAIDSPFMIILIFFFKLCELLLTSQAGKGLANFMYISYLT